MKKIALKIRGVIAYDLGILEKRFFWKTKRYLSKYYNKQYDLIPFQKKTLIYMLDGRCYSGGLTDVIRGIVSMFSFSKEIGFDFRINFCFPYKLHDYLEPNLYNWFIPENEISYNSNYSIPLWIYCSHMSNGKSREFENDFHKKILRNFIKTNATKQQFHIYTNSQFAQGTEYSLLFNELFKPTRQLQDLINFHKKGIGQEYISVTCRFQQLLGDFKEMNSPAPLNERDKSILINKCISKIIEINRDMFPNTKILVTSDSETFLSKVSKLEFVYVIPGKVIHLAYNPGKGNNVHIKTFLDLLLLSEAKKIFLLCTDLMYRSGFAKYASYINNREYQEICF